MVYLELTPYYKHLWSEYKAFLECNEVDEKQIFRVYWIWNKKLSNNNCLLYDKYMSEEETSMYNLTIDNNHDYILTSNEKSYIYIELEDQTILFRCGNICLQPSNYRFVYKRFIGNFY
jgi:hypothetical protein